MTFDLTNFSLSLAVAIATAAGVTPGVDLVVNRAITGDAPCAVLTAYSGPEPEEFSGEAATHSLQIMTLGMAPAATMALAMKLYNACYETIEGQERTPRCHWVIAGKRAEAAGYIADGDVAYDVHWVALKQVPGQLGVDPENGRMRIAFNVEVRFEQIS